MPRLSILSATDQVASFLKSELLAGAWTGLMPGGDRLAAELGVGRDTIEAALGRLEEEGILVNQGRRRRRRIELAASQGVGRRMRVGLLLDEAASRRLDYLVELEHELARAGHLVFHPPRSMSELGQDPARIAAMMEGPQVDAWLVLSGTRDLLERLSAGPVPAFAIFGRRRGLPIGGVGPDKPLALAKAARHLIGLGHRRISLLVRPRRRLPGPGASERAFLGELSAAGISPGAYHLPDWEESIEGFHGCLESLFKVTPPTALIIDESPFLVSTLQFLGKHGLQVPEDVSLVCTDDDPCFAWCRPSVAHIRWDSRPVVKRIVTWVGAISRGRMDRRQTLTASEFVSGATVGPAKE